MEPFLQWACSPTTMSSPINSSHFWPSISTTIVYHCPCSAVIDTVFYCRSLEFYRAISSPAALFGPPRASSWLLPNKRFITTGLCSQRCLNNHRRAAEAFRSELRSLPPTAQNCSLSSDDSRAPSPSTMVADFDSWIPPPPAISSFSGQFSLLPTSVPVADYLLIFTVTMIIDLDPWPVPSRRRSSEPPRASTATICQSSWPLCDLLWPTTSSLNLEW